MKNTLRCQTPNDTEHIQIAPLDREIDRRFKALDGLLKRVRRDIFQLGWDMFDLTELAEPVPENHFNALKSEAAYIWEGVAMAISRASGYSVTLEDEVRTGRGYPAMCISGPGSDAVDYALQGSESDGSLETVDARSKRLYELYRLTCEEWEKILVFQKGVCAISGEPAGSKRLATDHCHKTGRIRGLLDWRMNRAIAMFRDDPKLLRAAADYLERPSAPRALGKETYGLLGKAQRKRKMIYGKPQAV